MPPVQALAALHLLWVVILAPPTVYAVRRWPAARQRLLGNSLVVLAAVGLLVVAGHEASTWLPSVGTADQRYLGHRVLFVLAARTEAPLLQMAAAGAACWLAGRRRESHSF